MGWSLGYDHKWKRDVGYGVPAFCDHPKCKRTIDRGLGYVCGGDPLGGEYGCGLYFCETHLSYALVTNEYGPEETLYVPLCQRCQNPIVTPPFTPKPEHPSWLYHKATHPSWEHWRNENNPTQPDPVPAEKSTTEMALCPPPTSQTETPVVEVLEQTPHSSP